LRKEERTEIFKLSIIIIAIVAVFSTILIIYVLVFFIDTIVHQVLYQYGLQFSYEWANPYWMYLRISLTLLFVVTIAIVALTSIALFQRKKLKMEIKEELEPLKIEKEMNRLRRRLWRMQGRRTRLVGWVLLALSACTLILGYETRWLFFEATALVSLLLGLILVFLSLEPYIHFRVASRAMLSPLKSLDQVLSQLGIGESFVYLPPTMGQSVGKLFIPTKQGTGGLLTLEEIQRGKVVISGKGVLVLPTGSDLLRLFEEELGVDFRLVGLSYVFTHLPPLIRGLGLAEKVQMTKRSEDEIALTLTRPAYRSICLHAVRTQTICGRAGCPLCSSIAAALAKAAGRLVGQEKTEYDEAAQATRVIFKLGSIFPP